MIIKKDEAHQKEIGTMRIREYRVNSQYSGALIETNGTHGRIKCLHEDRLYFIVSGKGVFTINDQVGWFRKVM